MVQGSDCQPLIANGNHPNLIAFLSNNKASHNLIVSYMKQMLPLV